MARKTLKKFGGEVPDYIKERETGLPDESVDSNILALLAKKKKKQGQLTSRGSQVPQREPKGSALSAKSMPIDPRQRAAMLMQQKIQKNLEDATGKKKKRKKKKVPNPNV